MLRQQQICVLMLLALLAASATRAQDYDDEGYGNQGGGANGAGNQGDNDGYQNNYNDDGYNGNMPNNYQQNVDPESSNNNPSNYSPQGGGSGDADGDYEGDDGSAAAAASSIQPTVLRVRRSVGDQKDELKASSAPKLRVKRHGKYYIGPVYTYVKTDKHANFKWGVKHKVGKKHYG